MPDTQTQHYAFVKPEVGSSQSTWGNKWNANLDLVDAAIKGVSDARKALVDSLKALAFRDTVGTVQIDNKSVTFAKLADAIANSLVPLGSVIPNTISGYIAPGNWLPPDGRAIDRVGFAEYFAAVGTRYGAGNGSTTFNIPDLRGRFIAVRDNIGIGAASRLTFSPGGVDGSVTGAVGGEQLQYLSAGQMPSHRHEGTTFGNGNHSHGRGSTSSAGGDNRNVVMTGGDLYVNRTTTDGYHDHYFETNYKGSGQGHNNIPPVMVLDALLRVK